MDSSQALHRHNSGRDSKKAEGQRLSLGGAHPAREKQSFNLVVCGATDYKDGFIFSDFMGYCMALKEHGVGGDFFSCFPISDHFIWLRNENSPAIDVVKFGKFGTNGSKALYTYSRHAFLNRQYWWTQVGAHELLEKVQSWIVEKQTLAEDGDIVNIILEGHGCKGGGELIIGKNWIHPSVLSNLLRNFKVGVQVNAVSGACYSGRFVDIIKTSGQTQRYVAAASPGESKAYATTRSISNRVRNSRFSQAFVQSLAKVNLPGRTRRQITWRLKDHEAFMKEELMRNLTPGGTVSEPQFYASEPLDGMTVVEDMIFCDKIDVLYDPCVASRRRRIEWPTIDPVICDLLMESETEKPPPPDVSSSAKTLIDEEIAKCDTRRGLLPDLEVYDELYLRRPNWRQILRNLYWRARRQSAIWDVFELLISRGFLSSDCLTIPIDLLGKAKDSSAVLHLLSCFSLVSEKNPKDIDMKISLQHIEWDYDLHW